MSFKVRHSSADSSSYTVKSHSFNFSQLGIKHHSDHEQSNYTNNLTISANSEEHLPSLSQGRSRKSRVSS